MKKKRELKELGIQSKVIPMIDFAELSFDNFAKRLTEYGVSLSDEKAQVLYETLRESYVDSDSEPEVEPTKTEE